MTTVEKKAMELIMEYEKKQGRTPRDVHKTKCGYDIKSGTRCIEVKGAAQKGKIPHWIGLYKKVISQLGGKVMNYYIYIVYDVNNEPKLLIFPPKVILSNLEVDHNFVIHPKRVLKDNKKIKSISL